jgi:hypothetical protein
MAGASSAARSIEVRREAGIGKSTVGMKNVLSRWAWQAGKKNYTYRQLRRWHTATRSQMLYLQIMLIRGMIDA